MQVEVSRQKPAWTGLGVVAVLMAVGAVLRFWRLGELGLIVDEGYQALAVRGILEHGYPLLDSGEIYSRSFIFLYIQAFCCWLLGQTEFAMRFPAALFGVLVIPVAYWFGRTLFNVRVGLVLAALIALSAWEVELSRYARFYTLLQICYLVGLVTWYRWYIQGEKKWAWAFVAAFWLTIVAHHFGVMLALSFLIILPLRGYTVRQRVWAVGWTGLFGALWVVWNNVFNFLSSALGTYGDDTYELSNTTTVGGLPTFKLPQMRLVQQAWTDHPTLFAGVLLLAGLVSVGLILLTVRSCRRHRDPLQTDRPTFTEIRERGAWVPVRAVLVVGIMWCGVVHSASLALVLTFVYLAFFVRTGRQLLRQEFLLAAVLAQVGIAAWILWFRFSPNASLTAGLEEMFKFPGLWDYFFKWTIYGWPVMLVLWAIAFFVIARHAVRPDFRCNPHWMILMVTVLPMVVTAQLAWKFSESRYFFHLYPLLLTWLALLIVAVGDALARSLRGSERGPIGDVAVAGVAVAIMLVSHDANGLSAWAVSTRTHTSVKDEQRSVINFPWHDSFHQDIKTAAVYARPLIKPGDVTISFGPTYQSVVYAYYLGHLDYMITSDEVPAEAVSHLRPDGSPRFLYEPKSNVNLLYWPRDLIWVLQDARSRGVDVWVFGDETLLEPRNWYLRSPKQDDHRIAAKQREALAKALLTATKPVYRGLDGTTTVQQIDPGQITPEMTTLPDIADE